MRSKGLWLAVLVAGIGLAGVREARGQATHVAVVKKLLTLLDRVADSLAQVKDQATAEKATAGLEEGTKQLKQLTRSLEALGKSSPEQNEQVKELEKNVKAIFNRFSRESTRLPKKLRELKLPDATRKKALAALEGLRKEMRAFAEAAQGTGG